MKEIRRAAEIGWIDIVPRHSSHIQTAPFVIAVWFS
jgi:hypothetical protein